MNTTWGVIKPDYICTTASRQPTRICSVCDTNEFKDASLCYEDKFWLCPECLNRLKKLLYKENKE